MRHLTEEMKATLEIPREPLNVHHNSCGFLPQVGLHRRGDLYLQESSYSHFWLSGVMLVASVVVAMLPWHTKASPGGELKYYISGMLVWGCICSVLPYFIRNEWGQNILVHPKTRTLSITNGDFRAKLSWDQIIGLQICLRKVAGDSEMNGYQLNLVWLGAGGTAARHCLLQHSAKGFAVRLGRRYASLFGFPLMDHTRNRQEDSATAT